MPIRTLIAALLLFPGFAGAVDDDHEAAYRDAVGSVVWITNYDRDWNPSYGTGVVLEGGDILTAQHVIDSGPSMVTFPEYDKDGGIISDSAHYMADKSRLLPCTIVSEDRDHDIALLRLVTARPGVRPIRMAAKGASPGQPVFAIGNTCHPGVLFRLAAGHVRQVSEQKLDYGLRTDSTRYVQMTIPLNRGDSGGPVLRKGELVGMNVLVDDGKNLISYAVDVAEIRAFLDRAKEIEKEQKK